MRWDLCVLGNALILAGCASPYAEVSRVHPHLIGAPGASLLAGRKGQKNLRALAVMNGMTMCTHKYEEYVDPGGFVQGVGHVFFMPRTRKAKFPYSPGALTAALLHVPIGITYIGALRAEGPIGKSTWMKSLGVLGLFLALGVANNVRMRRFVN